MDLTKCDGKGSFEPTTAFFAMGNSMKKLLSLPLALLPFMAIAAPIEEELFVLGSHPELVRELARHPDLSVDHVHEEGFEVYGPRGLSELLEERGVSFFDMAQTRSKDDNTDYPAFEQVRAKLQDLAARFPSIARLETIGRSVQGRELLVLKISDNVGRDEVEPEFKYISSMHGDEITGRELTLRLAEEMLSSYGRDRQITDLIDNTEIYIMPSMNPDGSTARRRANANGYDLNRNFPEFVRRDPNTPAGRQVEVQAIMAFQASRNFSLSANFHGGAVVVNYPWDSRYEAHPLEDMIKDLSLEYANLNAPMRASTEFRGGIVNGADWYIVEGGMQDWSYIWHNDLQVTIELSDIKWPSYALIPNFYRDNRASMLRYAELVHQGAGVKLSDRSAEGRVVITDQAGRSLGSFGFQRGEFYKVLPAGSYVFEVTSAGQTRRVNVRVDDRIAANGNFVAF